MYYKLICKYNGRLEEVKRKNNWLLPNKYILNIDTELTKAKSKMPISKWWFLLSLFIGVIPFILSLINKNEYFSMAAICAGTSIAGTIILFIICMTYVRGRTIVLGIVYGHRRIINMQNELISCAKNHIYVDSDDYWINGMFYKNPYDSSGNKNRNKACI